MANGEMPDIEMNVDLSDLPEIDMTAMLLRRFAWDTMPCPEVADLLTALGLTHGTDEGMHLDHAESHHRMAQAFPLEPYLQRFAEILGVVVSTAMTRKAGVELGEDSVKFAEQNAEVVLHSARAIIAQFIETGVLTYGPRVSFVATGAGGE
jgi:hypothetical protein